MFKRFSPWRILQIVTVLALLFASVFFIKLAFASIIATRPNMAIVDLERTATVNDVSMITQHINRLEMAINLYPSNANFYVLLGRYNALQAALNPEHFDSIKTASYFAQAVELEPSAYQHRTRQIQYLYSQQAWTQDINHKLEVALKVGKYEKLPQQILLPIVFENWQQLSKTNQQYTHQMLDNMLANRHFYRQALRVAKKFCTVALLQSHVINAKQTNEVDKQLAKQQGCVK